MPKMMALLSSQGTACGETGLCEKCDTPETRSCIEITSHSESMDAPVKGSWTEVTGNEAVECALCGMAGG